MKAKLCLLILILIACAGYASAQEAEDITPMCRISGVNSPELLTDRSMDYIWYSRGEGSALKITFPEGSGAQGIYMEWVSEESVYTLSQYDKDGNLLSSESHTDRFPALNVYYPLERGAAYAVFTLADHTGICDIYVYGEGSLPKSLQLWEPPYDDADIMLIVAHQDDEELWFGGLIPYYDVVLGKKLSVVYMTNCSRYRKGEALTGLWSMGVRNYPVFLNYKDGKVEGGRVQAVDAWGGEEAVTQRLYDLIQSKKPEVIVTHDIAGEYGHVQHRATSWITEVASLLPGEFTVQKFYRHLGNENVIYMDWDTPYWQLGGLTPLEVATIGMEAHWSQRGYYNMSWGGKDRYDNTKFSLIYSLVGPDVIGNDFLENIK